VLRLVKCVRAVIEGATRMSSACCGLIQTSTERVHGPAVLLGERFESGIIIRNLRFYFHGSRERMALHGLRRQRLTALHLRRRINRVIGTTTVVIAEIVITIDSRVNDKWSFEQLLLVQRIMNTVEKTSTEVTPGELILSHSIRLSSHIMPPISSVDSSDISPFDRMDE
jgi:hypothetical protein